MFDRLKCKLGWHKWDKYVGWHEERPALDARCERCSWKYKWLIEENK